MKILLGSISNYQQNPLDTTTLQANIRVPLEAGKTYDVQISSDTITWVTVQTITTSPTATPPNLQYNTAIDCPGMTPVRLVEK